MSQRRRILLLVISLVVLALIPVVYVWRTPAPATSAGMPRATPLPALSDGWRYVNPAVSQHVAAVPGDDRQLVSCGARDGQVRFSASHDGGRHWSAAVVVGAGNTCLLSAATARLVAVVTTTCVPCSLPAPWSLSISQDAGTTWQAIAGPGGLATFGGLLAWQGTLLFTSLNAGATTSSATGNHVFAAWTPAAGLHLRDAGLLAQGVINLSWLGSTAGDVIVQCTFAQSGTQPGAPPSLCAFRSADGGRTWQRLAATDPLNSAFLVSSATTLIAFDRQTVSRSADGGATWQPLAALPDGTTLAPSPASVISATPAAFLAGDRLFVGLQGATTTMIAALPTMPAGAWQTVAPLCDGCLFQAVTAGPGNSDVTLWALSDGGAGSLVALAAAYPTTR